jgi:hypothetical protein
MRYLFPKGKKNPKYIDGRRSGNKYYCKCGKEIDYRAKHCRSCEMILHPTFKGKRHTTLSKKLIGKKSSEKFTPEYIKKNYTDKFNGNKKRDINGYTLIKDYSHPNRNSHDDVLEHIKIMSDQLKRPIKKGEVIHHINFVRSDNRLKNLYLFSNISEHGKASKSLFKLVKNLLEFKVIEFKEGRYILNKKYE